MQAAFVLLPTQKEMMKMAAIELPAVVKARATNLVYDFYSDDAETLESGLRYMSRALEETRPTPEEVADIGLDGNERIHVAWTCIAAGFPADCGWV